MDFGKALEALKEGKRVARKGWNGKGMYLYLVHGCTVDKENLRNEASFHLPCDEGAMHGTGVANFLSHIDMRTANGDVCVGWLASQTDMLAEDWVIVSTFSFVLSYNPPQKGHPKGCPFCIIKIFLFRG